MQLYSRFKCLDELDAIGSKRQDSELSGDREVQRTMLELLNQLDGFSSDDRVKVIAATNRPDTLDPALLRSGRLDRKIELPHPNEGKEKILILILVPVAKEATRAQSPNRCMCAIDLNCASLYICVPLTVCGCMHAILRNNSSPRLP